MPNLNFEILDAKCSNFQQFSMTETTNDKKYSNFQWLKRQKVQQFSVTETTNF